MVYVLLPDQTQIFYEITGRGSTALLLVHGWLGCSQWWNSQRDYLQDAYTIVQMDLPGHGRSGPFREGWSHGEYAAAIQAVARDIKVPQIILVGHSMSGAYVLEASLDLPQVKALIVVDTLKDLDQLFTIEQAEQGLFPAYRQDFKSAIANILPQFLYSAATPPSVKERLQQEFSACDGEKAIQLLAPLYKMDPRTYAQRVTVPVRAINSDYMPTLVENNRKYLRDYECFVIAHAGHYPMLERPEAFNHILEQVLQTL